MRGKKTNGSRLEERFVTPRVWHGKRARPVVEIGKDVEELWDAGIAAPVQTSMTNLLSSTRRGRAVGQRPRLWNVATLEINYIIPFFRNIVKRERVGERNRETNQSLRSIHSTFHDDFSIFHSLSQPHAFPARSTLSKLNFHLILHPILVDTRDWTNGSRFRCSEQGEGKLIISCTNVQDACLMKIWATLKWKRCFSTIYLIATSVFILSCSCRFLIVHYIIDLNLGRGGEINRIISIRDGTTLHLLA